MKKVGKYGGDGRTEVGGRGKIGGKSEKRGKKTWKEGRWIEKKKGREMMQLKTEGG